MIGMLFGVFLGAVIIVLAPALLPERFKDVIPVFAIRVFGALVILFSLASTSFVYVPNGYSAHLFRVYLGRSLPPGKIVAANGENGPQGRLLAPGFHIEPLINVLYDVDATRPEFEVPQNKVGILAAKDGAPLRFGQTFADPFPTDLGYNMLDAERFLGNGGQRGPQLSVLTPGRYRLNSYLWTRPIGRRRGGPSRFRRRGQIQRPCADIDFGTLKADKPENCAVIENEENRGEQHIDAPIVPVGCIGVWAQGTAPGKYYLEPERLRDHRHRYARAGLDLCRRIQRRRRSRSPSIPRARSCRSAPSRTFLCDENNADKAIFVKMEGWDVPLELRVVAQVGPSDAACVVAGIGTLKQVEDRVLTPSIRAITRDVAGGTYEVTEAKVDENGKPVLDPEGKPIIVTVNRPTKVLDLINQRPLIESEIERRIRPEAAQILRDHPRGAPRRASHSAGAARRRPPRAARYPARQGVHSGAGGAAAARQLGEGEGDRRSAVAARAVRNRGAALGAESPRRRAIPASASATSSPLLPKVRRSRWMFWGSTRQ